MGVLQIDKKKKSFYKSVIASVMHHNIKYMQINSFFGFPGDSVIKNPPAKAGDMASILDPGRSHVPPNG